MGLASQKVCLCTLEGSALYSARTGCGNGQHFHDMHAGGHCTRCGSRTVDSGRRDCLRNADLPLSVLCNFDASPLPNQFADLQLPFRSKSAVRAMQAPVRCGMAGWRGHPTVDESLLHLVLRCVRYSARTNLHLSSSKSCDYGTCDWRAHAIFYGSRSSLMAAMRNEVVIASLLCTTVLPSRQPLCTPDCRAQNACACRP